MLIAAEVMAIRPAGINLPLFFALRPITDAKVRQVAKASNVPTRYVGFPIRDAEIKRSTAMPEETIRLVWLPFLK